MKKPCVCFTLFFLMVVLMSVSSGAFCHDRAVVPEGISKAGWEKIKATVERDRYRLEGDERTGGYQAFNHVHGFAAGFTEDGLAVSLRKGDMEWKWGLSLSRYGYGPDLDAIPGTERIIVKGNRIEYHRGDLVEWYINDHRGIEQGFTLKSRPVSRTGSGPFLLEMKGVTGLVPYEEKGGRGIIYRDARGNEVLRYCGLYAHDAEGKELSARMSADREGILLVIDDHDAVYPITIDPFIETRKLTASDGAASDYFGYSVSISGDTAIVGAYRDDNYSGSAYIFSRDQGGANNWGQVKKLTASDGAADDRFGYSVSISGDTVIVGAWRDDDKGTNSGSAYIFYRDQGGANNWGEVKKLTASDGADYDDFGYSVSISGDRAIVGARLDDDKGDGSGSAYIFSRDQGGSDNWGEVKKLTASDGAASDDFGYSVSISGDTAIVGARYDDDKVDDSGSAYMFSRDQGGANNWGEVKKLLASDGVAWDCFGWSVSISGDTVIVGAPYDDDSGTNSGSAYIFYRDQGGANNWGQVKKLTASDGAASDEFGWSVSISGDVAIVGARWDDDNGIDSGSAYIFYRDQGGANNWGEVKKLTASDGAAADYFGWSVSISGDMAIVGAWGDDDNGSDSGSAYIFSAVADELAVDFGPGGIYDYDNGTWTWLTGSDPEDMVAVGNALYADFGSSGIHKYYGGTWTWITSTDPEDMVAVGSDLYADFGSSGIYKYDGSWTWITSTDPEDMVAVGNDLYADFGSSGIYKYDGSWTWITSTDPEDMIAVDLNP